MRIRFKALHELAPNEKREEIKRSKCRFRRRRLRYLLNAFELRQKKHGHWTETHIWHAKRFHMASRWGVKYATRCSDKSDRSTYRLVQRNSACVMDRSYFATFEISSQADDGLAPLLSAIGLNTSLQGGPSLSPSYRELQVHSEDGSQLLAPVEVLMLGHDRMLLTVHPSAADQITSLISAVAGEKVSVK